MKKNFVVIGMFLFALTVAAMNQACGGSAADAFRILPRYRQDAWNNCYSAISRGLLTDDRFVVNATMRQIGGEYATADDVHGRDILLQHSCPESVVNSTFPH